jgi:chromosome segregation ATPase
VAKKELSVERKIELLRKDFQGKTRLIEAVRRLIEAYEGDLAKLQNERNEIEQELFVLEKENGKKKEKEDALCFSNTSQSEKNGRLKRKSF